MASVFEQLQEKYKGLTVEVSGEEKRTTITYQGSRELCEEAIQSTFKVNASDPIYGNIENIRMTNADGPIWTLEITYSIDTSHGYNTSTGSTFGAKSSELSMSMLSIPLEKLSNYEKRWNNNLYCTKTTTDIPNWWYSATYENDHIMGTENEYPR